MSDWKEYKLSDIVDIKHGYAFKGESFSDEPTNNILVTPGNFKIGGGFKGNKLKYHKGDIPTDYILSHEDIIVTMTDLSKQTDTLGFSAKVPNDNSKVFLHNQRIGLLQFKNSAFSSEFLYWLMRAEHYQKFVAGSATGATVKHTSPTKIRAFKFKAPSDDIVRKKIAKILSNYDELIENNFKRMKLLKESTRLIYEEWFLCFKIDGKKLEVDSETSLPFGWEKKKLKDITSYVARGISPKYVESNGAIVLNQKCIRDNFVNIDLSRSHSLDKKVSKEKKLQFGDVLINSTGTGTLGRVAQIFEIIEGMTVDSHVSIVRANEMISPYILGRTLEYLEEYITNLGKGATNQQELGRADLESLVQIIIPPVDYQDKYEKYASPIFKEINNLRKENQLLIEARDILLPRLMTGMIDVDNMKVAI